MRSILAGSRARRAIFAYRAGHGQLGLLSRSEVAVAGRTGTGPLVMAALRNLVISILRMAGHVGIAVALQHTAGDPLRAFRLLTGRSNGQ